MNIYHYFQNIKETIQKPVSFDFTFLTIVLMLLMIGLIALSSASSSISESISGSPFFYLNRQIFAVVLGFFSG